MTSEPAQGDDRIDGLALQREQAAMGWKPPGTMACMAAEIIRLGQFLKYANLAETGGQAGELIASAAVTVDGEVETRRGRQLRGGEVVEVRCGAQVLRAVVELAEPDVAW